MWTTGRGSLWPSRPGTASASWRGKMEFHGDQEEAREARPKSGDAHSQGTARRRADDVPQQEAPRRRLARRAAPQQEARTGTRDGGRGVAQETRRDLLAASAASVRYADTSVTFAPSRPSFLGGFARAASEEDAACAHA